MTSSWLEVGHKLRKTEGGQDNYVCGAEVRREACIRDSRSRAHCAARSGIILPGTLFVLYFAVVLFITLQSTSRTRHPTGAYGRQATGCYA